MDNGNHYSHQYEYTNGHPAPSAIGATDVPWILRRGWVYLVVGCLIGMAAAAFYIAAAPSLYKASARILLDRTVNRYLQNNKIIDEPTFDDAEIGGQIYILTSESIVVPVVRSMNLVHDPEFVGQPNARGVQGLWDVGTLITTVKQFLGLYRAIPMDSDAARERIAVENFLKRLSVSREDVANVISVTFASADPIKAANIANAVADTYIASISDAKLNSTKMASQLLQDRLMELKAQAMEAEKALDNYRTAHNFTYTGKGMPNAEQLAALNGQLTEARMTMAEAKAKLERAQRAPLDGVPSTADSHSLGALRTSLRQQYMELSARAAEIESRVGPTHTAVVKMRNRMAEIASTIREEEKRILGFEYQTAKARNSELAASVAQLAGEGEAGAQGQVTMRELESSADALRTLYNSILQKFKEINSAQTQNMPIQDVRIVTRAAPPLERSSKKSIPVLAGSIVLGLLLGAGAAIGREWAADVFRTTNAVKQATDISCVILPAIEANRKGNAALEGRGRSMVIEEFILDAPYSRFTETLRNVRALIGAAAREDGAKVIGIVSSVAKEGKTTIAANLAALMVASTKASTLLIDGDLHRRQLTAKLAHEAREGLLEALMDPSRLAMLVTKRERSGLDVLPCVAPDRFPNAAELLGSPQMEQLLAFARQQYDHVIIEIPPIASVVDVKVIERFIDRFIFVIEWGQTKRRLVQEALSETDLIRERIIGIILNKADPRALRTIEAYKGNRFKDYYEG